MTPEERNESYLSAHSAAREEYIEVEKQVKRLGDRLNALRMTLSGLGRLTGIKTDDLFTIGRGTIVITDENRDKGKGKL